MFIFGDLEINFPIYSPRQVDVKTKKLLLKDDVQEYLLSLDAGWLQFLVEFINIEKRYLQEFLEMDLEETIRVEIQKELTKLTTENGTSLEKLEKRLLDLPGWESIKQNSFKITETDLISRIVAICKIRFDEIYKTHPYEAKARLMTDLELGDDSVARLQKDNLEELAKVLVGIDNATLAKQMKEAYEKHAIKLSDHILRKIGVDIPQGETCEM